MSTSNTARRKHAIVLAGLTLLVFGCGTTRQGPRAYLFYQQPPAAAIRTTAGKTAIVAGTNIPAFQADQPMAGGEALRKGFGEGFRRMPQELRDSPPSDPNPGLIFALPIWMVGDAVVTAVACGLQGVSPETSARQQTTLRRAVEELRPAELLTTGMLTALNAEPVDTNAVVSLAVAGEGRTNSIVHVCLTGVTLMAEGDSVNPPLRLAFTVQVRWLRTDDGTELYRNEFSYRGIKRHKLATWAEADGRRFRVELQRICSVLGPRLARILWKDETGWTDRYCVEVAE